MIGLGVGIDYALFIVVRYREGLHEGRSPLAATMRAMDTAGRAVVFAGLTVVLSLLGILLIGLASLSGLAIGAAIDRAGHDDQLDHAAARVARAGRPTGRGDPLAWPHHGRASAAIALLGLGHRRAQRWPPAARCLAVVTLLASFVVRSLRRAVPAAPVKPVRETFAYGGAARSSGDPWRWLIAGTLILLVLASPILGLRLGFSDEGNYPEGTATRSAYDLLADGFGDGFNGPFIVTVQPAAGGIARLRRRPPRRAGSRPPASPPSPTRSSMTRRTRRPPS